MQNGEVDEEGKRRRNLFLLSTVDIIININIITVCNTDTSDSTHCGACILIIWRRRMYN